MKVKELMTKSVITTTVEANISEVAKMMQKYKIHGVPVVDGRHLVGIITETDFFSKGDMEIHLPSYADFLTKTGYDKEVGSSNDEISEILNIKVKDIMTAECITINPEDDVKDLIALFREKDLHTVPVVIGNALEGVVTVADVIKLL